MDESWRMRLGMPATPPPSIAVARPRFPNCRYSEDTTARKTASGDISGEHPLNPEDFTDVFGGPPRTVLSGHFSAGFPVSSSSNFSYEEIFRYSENLPPATGRSLKEFRIPEKAVQDQHHGRNRGFYTDIFGWDDEKVMRSRSMSKTSSSSILSSAELSPIRWPAWAEDSVSLFASNLRPINVKSTWNPSRTRQNDNRNQQNLPPFTGTQPVLSSYEYPENFKNYPFGFSRRNASPETISVEPISNGSFRVSTDCLEPISPASAVSSVCDSHMEQKTRAVEEDMLMQDQIELEEDDEVMSSYVIEITSDNREGTSESNGVDEAIAWAKEKFHKHCSESKWGSENSEKGKHLEENLDMNQFPGHTDSFGSLDEQQEKWALEEEIQPFESKIQIEMQVMDENIMLWSKGKESDIRLLLSSLHHILWPNSGWFPIPLTNIIESPKVKKAYQKARLCLHPDKLQQRGATLPQKYIAEKAFSVLQDAWAAFISQDIYRR